MDEASPHGRDANEAAGDLPWGLRIEDDVLFEGDMILGKASELLDGEGGPLHKAASSTDATHNLAPEGSWPLGIVPFVIPPSMEPFREDIGGAIFHYMSNTSMTFLEIPYGSTGDHLEFTDQGSCPDGAKCCADRGYLQGQVRHLRMLEPACGGRHTMLHELGHVLGLIHEHQRSDRDDYIEVSGLDSDPWWAITNVQHSLLTDYDPFSVMHYESPMEPGESVTYNGLPITRNSVLSADDVRGLQVMYLEAFQPVVAVAPGDAISESPSQAGFFARAGLAADGGLVHAWRSPMGWNVRYLGNDPVGAPTAVADGSDTLVYAVGKVGNLFRLRVRQHAAVGEWENLASPNGISGLRGSPVAVQGTEEVYVQDKNNNVVRWKGPKPPYAPNAWTNLGGLARQPVRAVRDGDEVHVFAISADSNLYHKYHDGSDNWFPGVQDWTPLPGAGYVRGQPSIVSCSPGTLEIVVKGPLADAWYQAYDGTSWLDAWVPLGGAVVGNPELTCFGSSAIAWATSYDRQIYFNVGSGSPGSRFVGSMGWVSAGAPGGGGAIAAPVVTFDGTELEIFVRTSDDHIYRRGVHSAFGWSPWERAGSASVRW